MAQFLEACVVTRGEHPRLRRGVGHRALRRSRRAATRASASASSRTSRRSSSASAHAVTLSIVDTRKGGEDCVRAAARLRPDRLIVTQLARRCRCGHGRRDGRGREGVLAAIAAPTLRQALSRLVAQLVLHRPGLGLEAMRDVVGEAFDVAIEVAHAARRPRSRDRASPSSAAPTPRASSRATSSSSTPRPLRQAAMAASARRAWSRASRTSSPRAA